MELLVEKINGIEVALLCENSKLVSIQDFVDLIGNADYLGANQVVLYKHQLPEIFFELKTRYAGTVLQKFSTYNQKLAIVGNFSSLTSNSFKAFIVESNRVGRIRFVNHINEV